MKILYVEDDKKIAITVRNKLRKHYVVDIAYSGKQAEYLAHINDYDLLILDLVLPDINGLQLCKNLRQSGIKAYILMLTGKTAIEDKVLAFSFGADDYITKPFHFDELLARIRAFLRRQSDNQPMNILSAGDLTLDITRKLVKRNDAIIPLRRKEYDLLEYFMRNVGRVITREMILDHVWDSSYESFGNTVDVHIKYLRDRIDRSYNKKIIKTVYGLGYKLDP